MCKGWKGMIFFHLKLKTAAKLAQNISITKTYGTFFLFLTIFSRFSALCGYKILSPDALLLAHSTYNKHRNLAASRT